MVRESRENKGGNVVLFPVLPVPNDIVYLFPVLPVPNDIVYLHAVACGEVSVYKLVQGEILHAASHLHAKVE